MEPGPRPQGPTSVRTPRDWPTPRALRATMPMRYASDRALPDDVQAAREILEGAAQVERILQSSVGILLEAPLDEADERRG